MTLTATDVSSSSASPSLPWIRTPLVRSDILSKLAGCNVYLKLENLQPSGSFKSRGIGNLVVKAIQAAPPKTPCHFYSSSGGNAGLACVTAASSLGYPSTVVVPLSTKPMMIDKIRLAGATDVIQIGQTWFDADQHLRNVVLANDPHGVYVPPFDHPDLWEGVATMVGEVEEQLGSLPDAIVCSVGGGSLITGLNEGLVKANAGGRTKVFAVETFGAESLHESVKAGTLVTLPGITSIATSLGAIRVAAKALEYALQPHVESVVVSDKEAVNACVNFANDERLLVEPACGATLAMVYGGKLKEAMELKPESNVVLVVCGGSNVSLDLLATYRELYDL
ncbi:hypothetical protein IAT38_006617 [Cryptococcus sp. DSM 104549]